MKNMIKVVLFLVVILLITFLLPTFSPALRTILNVFSCMFVATGLAYVTYPIVKYLRSIGIKGNYASALAILLFGTLIVVVSILTVQLMYPQIVRAIQLVQDSSSGIVWMRDSPELGKVIDYLAPYLDRFAQQALDYIANVTQNVISLSTKFIADFALISCLYMYILFDSEKIIKRIKDKLVYGSKHYEFVKQLNLEYMKYLRGLIIIIIITVVEYGVIYYAIGHPDWMALAALCAFSNLIPYFGGIIVNLIALATAVFVSSELFFAVLVCVIVLPTIEGNILNPLVHKKTIEISPIALLPAIFIGGAIFGFLGIVLSIPAIIFYKVFKQYYKDDVKRLVISAWNS